MVLLCLKIFIARILDVSLGSVRTIFLVKGRTLISAIIGFVEIIIWFVVVKDALTSDNNIWILLSYALGFATGTYIGGILSEKFISGNFGIWVVTNNQNKLLIEAIKKAGYGLTKMDIFDNDKYMIFIEINKKNFNHLLKVIKHHDPKAFIVVNETKYVENGFLK